MDKKTVDVKDLSTEQLKSIGFDVKNEIDKQSQALNIIYSELERREKEPKSEIITPEREFPVEEESVK